MDEQVERGCNSEPRGTTPWLVLSSFGGKAIFNYIWYSLILFGVSFQICSPISLPSSNRNSRWFPPYASAHSLKQDRLVTDRAGCGSAGTTRAEARCSPQGLWASPPCAGLRVTLYRDLVAETGSSAAPLSHVICGHRFPHQTAHRAMAGESPSPYLHPRLWLSATATI